MSEAPYGYNYIDAVTSQVTPSMIHTNSTIKRFFVRYLLQKAFSVYKWNLPDGWNYDYFRYVLYTMGYIAIIKTDKFGVIPQMCGLRGYDVFYRPTNAVITNPLLSGIIQPRIDRECVLVKLQPDYGGIMDAVNYYADMMALCAEGAGINILNSKLAYVFAVSEKSAAEGSKKLFDKISSGEPAVVVDKNMYTEDGKPRWSLFAQDVGRNYIAGDMLSDLRKWEQTFDTLIGIPNANTDKRERLITDEVNANNVEVKTLADTWLESLKRDCEKAREMFGIDFYVDWRFNPENATSIVTVKG